MNRLSQTWLGCSFFIYLYLSLFNKLFLSKQLHFSRKACIDSHLVIMLINLCNHCYLCFFQVVVRDKLQLFRVKLALVHVKLLHSLLLQLLLLVLLSIVVRDKLQLLRVKLLYFVLGALTLLFNLMLLRIFEVWLVLADQK